MSIQEAKRLTLDQLTALPITIQVTIDEEFLDFNQHMNVAWYFHLFNRATGGMQKWLGCDWNQIMAEGGSTFALEGHVRYLAETLVGEHVTVRTRLIDRTAKRIHYLHFMYNDDKHAVAATYEEIQAYMDMQRRKMAPYPRYIAERLDEVLAEHRALDWSAPVCGSMKP